MKFNFIHVSTRSISIELDNKDIYYSSKQYEVMVNNQLYARDIKTNVFSIYDLLPNQEYQITINNFSKTVKTQFELGTVLVKDFGAIGDGKTDDTQALQLAIYACPEKGRVLVSPGTYYTLPLHLKSNITIELQKDAILLGHVDKKKYPLLPPNITLENGKTFELGTWEGTPGPTYASLITGLNVSNVSIVGQGIIDGNAQNSDWWEKPKELQNGAWRPRTVFLNQCENIVLQGVTVRNSPSWTIHPYFSKNLKFIDLYIENPKNSPNTDGCDPESCDNVEIIGVNFSVGDDCIALKSGKMLMGMKYQIPCSNIKIRNCHMAHGHGAIVLGSEMSGGIVNLDVSQCYFEYTDRGLRVKTRRGRGKYAVIDKVKFSNIYMNHVLTPLVISMFYYCDSDGKTEYVWSKEKLPVDDGTPRLGDFVFSNIVCDNVHVAAGFFYGLPEQPIHSVTIDNMKFNYANPAKLGIPSMMSFLSPMNKQGLIVNDVENLIINNTIISGQDGDEVKLLHVKKYLRK